MFFYYKYNLNIKRQQCRSINKTKKQKKIATTKPTKKEAASSTAAACPHYSLKQLLSPLLPHHSPDNLAMGPFYDPKHIVEPQKHHPTSYNSSPAYITSERGLLTGSRCQTRPMNSRCVLERGQIESKREGWEEQERRRQRENTTPTQ